MNDRCHQSRAPSLARAALSALIAIAGGCAPNLASMIPAPPQMPTPPPIENPTRRIYLAPSGPGYDLITPDGIHVKTNDQYKIEATRKSAAAAIDRYWRDVRECALGVIPSADTELREKLLPEFPRHLSIEIADDWSVVKGPTTHRRMQAFPSLRRPGAFVTASREEESLYVKVVPELTGLSRQMAGEVNLWLGGNTNTLPTELSNVCAGLPCYRFAYQNSPSEAWADCHD
jgi:hypothetical protein